MNTKKGLLIIVLAVFCAIGIFAQSRIAWESTLYENEKINITEYLLEEDVFANGRVICKNKCVYIQNKTNNDMVVKMSYTIYITNGRTFVNREKRITDRMITLQPHGSITLQAKVEMLSYNRVVRKPPVSEQLPCKNRIFTAFRRENARLVRQPTGLPNKSNDLKSSFPDTLVIDSAHINNFELIHFRIIQRNFEIQ